MQKKKFLTLPPRKKERDRGARPCPTSKSCQKIVISYTSY